MILISFGRQAFSNCSINLSICVLQVAGSENKAVFTKGTAANAPQESSKSVPFSSSKGSAPATTAVKPGTAADGSQAGGGGGNGKQEAQSSSLSRLVTADELDVTVAKHPASLTARFLLIQQALSQVRLASC
jgi:hypothetical protein